MKHWFKIGNATRRLGNRGVAAIEYALIASLIALALMTSLLNVGDAVSNQFNDVDAGVSSGMKFQS